MRGPAVARVLWRAALLALGVLALAATAPASAQPAPSTVTGLVVAVDAAQRRVVVSHDSVPGVMAAMTMAFEVRDAAELADVRPGMAIAFRLEVEENGVFAEHLEIRKYETAEQDPLTARRLAMLSDIVSGKPRMSSLTIGAAVPDFALTDETGRRVTLSQFHGRVVAVNFIYTGCVLPQFCFRIANHFGTLQKRFAPQLGRDLVLLTVTFDPARDSPEVLADYAAQWKRRPDDWRFLTGDAAEVKRVCALFGVESFQDEGLMNHTSHTVVIDRRGVLAASLEGNRYTATQLGDLVGAVLGR